MTASDTDVAGGPTAKESSRALSMFGRFGWGLGDQLLSSVTNFLLGLVVARSVGARDLGAFSLAYATFTLSLGATRAIAGELLVVRHSAVSEEDWRYGVKRAAGTAVMTGVVVGAGCLVASVVVQGSLGLVLSVVGDLPAGPPSSGHVALLALRSRQGWLCVPERSGVGCGHVLSVRPPQNDRPFLGGLVHLCLGGSRMRGRGRGIGSAENSSEWAPGLGRMASGASRPRPPFPG